jgi:hypothetical protein
LQEFDQQVKTALAAKEGADEIALKAALTLKGKITAADLPKLEAFAATREDALKWLSTRVFVEFKQVEAIPRLVVPMLAKEKDAEARKSAMWKHWEANFGEREDFLDLTAALGSAFATHYEKVDRPTRKVIAEIFGLRAGTPAEFRRKIEQRAAPATEGAFK